MVEVRLKGLASSTGTVLEVNTHKHGDGDVGVVVHTIPHLRFLAEVHPFLNNDFGQNMNQDASFGGTPDMIHRGVDGVVLWTGSNIIGTKVIFNQDDERAFGGIITVVDFTSIALATVTIGVDGSDTILTEGTDWFDTTGNNETATSLASAISGVTGVTASATGAIITITLNVSTSNISKLDTSDGTNLPGTAASVKIDNPAINDVWEFDKGSNLTISNYTAISGKINVDKDWTANDSIEMFCYDTGSASEVGLRVQIEEFINFGDFDTWQGFAVPFASLGITAEATFDAIRFQQISKSGPAPKWYLDNFQVEQTGTPVEFKATTPIGTKFHIAELRLRFEDAFVADAANLTIPNIPIDALLGVSGLTNGIVFKQVQRDITIFSATFRNLGDFLSINVDLINLTGDSTNTGFTLKVTFIEPIVLEGDNGTNYLSLTIADNLSGLTRLQGFARGAIEQ